MKALICAILVSLYSCFSITNIRINDVKPVLKITPTRQCLTSIVRALVRRNDIVLRVSDIAIKSELNNIRDVDIYIGEDYIYTMKFTADNKKHTFELEITDILLTTPKQPGYVINLTFVPIYNDGVENRFGMIAKKIEILTEK